jgi:Family of unknown function (DUF5662)
VRRHLAYLWYVLLHKWYVLKACWLVQCPMWLGLVHDLSKFRWSEWGPYARAFYNKDGSKRDKPVDSLEFALAWNLHQGRNRHHWQFWVLIRDRGPVQLLPMPDKYVREMVADWCGAGMAINGKMEVWNWYEAHRDDMLMHEQTRIAVDGLVEALRMRHVFESLGVGP